mgnify:CR=1 FL=1
MAHMAGAAVARILSGMLVACRLGMANPAVDLPVRVKSLYRQVQRRRRSGRHGAPGGALRAVAGEAQGPGMSVRPGGARFERLVALHAGLIGRGESRKAFARFVAGAALALRRPGGVVGAGSGDPQLGVGIVAGEAAFVLLPGRQGLTAVPPLLYL